MTEMTNEEKKQREEKVKKLLTGNNYEEYEFRQIFPTLKDLAEFRFSKGTDTEEGDTVLHFAAKKNEKLC